MTGTIDCFFVSPSLIMQYLKAGKLRALGVSSARRIALLPDVPTFGEFGIEADIPGWSGFWGPPKLAPARGRRAFPDAVQGRARKVVRGLCARQWQRGRLHAADLSSRPMWRARSSAIATCCRRSASRWTERARRAKPTPRRRRTASSIFRMATLTDMQRKSPALPNHDPCRGIACAGMTGDGDRDQVEAAGDAVGRIVVQPAGTWQVDLDPCMRRPRSRHARHAARVE